MVHKGDFLHRDIAPDNIIIRQDKSPVLIDFGSARGEIASHSKTVSALVKPGYSPYEQYATTSSKQGPWTDIYALGATLYHAIAGKRPPDSPSRMVNDEYVSAREAALSSYRPGFLAAVDKALNLEVTERPQSVAEWKAMLLAPEAKREKGRLGLPGRKPRTIEVRPEPAPPVTPVTVPLPQDDPLSLVPAPPDAPQNKGQLLDFIEALKKNRPNLLTPRKKPAEAKKRSSPAKEPEPEARAPARPRFKLGYGPALDIPGDAPAGTPKPAPAVAKAKLPVPVARRAPPRPRRMRSWTIPPRQWRSLAFKLLVGIGIASLAVAYQDKVPQIQGRGAGLVSSQSADLTQVPRLTGHNGAINAVALADQGRWIVSAGSDGTLKIWNTGSGALVRTIELDEGAATALAVDERRALTGHKGGAVVLWDLGPRREACRRAAPRADLLADPHRRSQPFLRRQPGRCGGAVRCALAQHPGAAVGRCRDRCAAAGARPFAWPARHRWPRPQHPPVAHRQSQCRARLAYQRPGHRRTRYHACRTHHRERRKRRAGAPVDSLVLTRAAYIRSAPGARHRARLRSQWRPAGHGRRGWRRQGVERPQRPQRTAHLAWAHWTGTRRQLFRGRSALGLCRPGRGDPHLEHCRLAPRLTSLSSSGLSRDLANHMR
jgi:hypothetical protein